MGCIVTVTFDISNAKPDDYNAVYEGLAKIGLKHTITPKSGKPYDLPTTTVFGRVDDEETQELMDTIDGYVKKLFNKNKLHGKVYIHIGGTLSPSYLSV